MNTKDSYCFICGIALSRGKEFQYKKYAWMDELTLLLPYINSPLHGFKQADTEVFCNKITDVYFNTEGLPGYVCHTSCWEYILKTYGKELTFESVRHIKLNPYRKYLADKQKYYPANRYYGTRFFLHNKKLLDYHKYIMRSPLKSKKNANRIDNLCKLMKII